MRKFMTAIALVALLSGCSSTGGMSSGNTPGSYCYEHTTVCVVGGVIVAGVVTAIIVHNNNNDSSAPPSPSDVRLKRDIKPLMVTDNGIHLYTFRYLGDNRLFSGAMAQELLANPKFSAAVVRNDSGFYAVDYAKLGLSLVNGDAMAEAGKNAERLQSGR